LVASNIAKGKNIFGVAGTYDPGVYAGFETKRVSVWGSSDGDFTESIETYFPISIEFEGRNGSGYYYLNIGMKSYSTSWLCYGYQCWGYVTFAKGKRYALNHTGNNAYIQIPENAIIPIINENEIWTGSIPVKYASAVNLYSGNYQYPGHIMYKDGVYVCHSNYEGTLYYYLPE
jgi:hypothetical protein